MAKTKKFYGDYTYVVTPSSKNKTIEYVGDEKIKLTIQTDISGKNAKKYIHFPVSTEAIKVGNNLQLITHFATTSYKIKTITTTIKNYFVGDNYEPIELFSPVIDEFENYTINSTNIGKNGIYAQVEDDENKNYILTSNVKNSELTLSNGGGDFVYDKNGNDKYLIKSEYYNTKTNKYKYVDSIIEEKGNDIYTSTSKNAVYIYDGKGNDIYNATGEFCLIRTHDFDGKDKYYANNNANLKVIEYNGNDRYELDNNNSSYIEEYKGKDTYIIKNSKHKDWENLIKDFSGNDKYTITDSNYTEIKETKGNDKFNIINSELINIEDTAGKDKYYFECTNTNISITENAGKDYYRSIDETILTSIKIEDLGNYNDKYKLYGLNNSEIKDLGGNDSYTLTNSGDETTITDNLGKDKYTLKSCDNLTIEDQMSTDKYVINDSVKITINDLNGSKDSYKLTNTTNFEINDLGEDLKGDSYSLKSSVGMIIDANGNDSYKIDSLNFSNLESNEVIIKDKAGEKDSLTISKAKVNDIVLLTNYDSSGNDENGTLIIYDKTNKGFISIEDFFANNNDNEYENFGSGEIEKIKIGKKTLKIDEITTCDNLNSIKESVASWISNSDFNNVNEVLSTGTQEQIDSLIACFQGTQV